MTLLFLISLAAACAVLAARAIVGPPKTRVAPVRETLHGVEIVDPYRWLEGNNSDPERMGEMTDEVAEWTDAQNAWTRAVLDALPGRAALEDRLRPLLEVDSVSAPSARADRYFFARRQGSQDQPVWYWREGYRGQDRLLLDPEDLDDSGLTTVAWISPDPDGRRVAWGSYRAGDENTTLRLMEVDTGRDLGLVIEDKVQPPQWLPDGSGFVYQKLSDPADPYSGRVLFHRIGGDPKRDALLFRQLTKEEDAELATTWGPGATLSKDGRWLVLYYWTGTDSNDVWVADFRQFLETGALERREASVGEDGTAFGTVVGGTLYLKTTKGSPRGRVIAVPAAQPERDGWREVVPEHPSAVIEGAGFGKGSLAVQYLLNSVNRIEVFDLEGVSRGELSLPGPGSTGLQSFEDRTEAYLTFTSFNFPSSIYRVDLAEPRAEAELWERSEVPADHESVEVRQVWYTSKDGTRVSMFLVHRKDLERDGARPVYLTGYGGFNINRTPVCSATLFHWFEEGGVYALPNLRGGGEYGKAWHRAGMLEHKQNVFDDFIAAAEWLVAEGYTRPGRLAIAGGSNGGLLTGAALTQRPDLFAAAIVAVPLLDMLRYQHFLMARYWVPEYGDASDADQFPFLHAYSPYHRVRDGVRYPAVLLTAGENDSRVHPLHARKMAALLQARTASDPMEDPVLLWVDRDAGHGHGKPLNLVLREVVDQRIFVMWQLGMLTSVER